MSTFLVTNLFTVMMLGFCHIAIAAVATVMVINYYHLFGVLTLFLGLRAELLCSL